MTSVIEGPASHRFLVGAVLVKPLNLDEFLVLHESGIPLLIEWVLDDLQTSLKMSSNIFGVRSFAASV